MEKLIYTIAILAAFIFAGISLYMASLNSIQYSAIQDINAQLISKDYDINYLIETGNKMYNQLGACYETTKCLNDWNRCEIKDNIDLYGTMCLNTKAPVELYKVFIDKNVEEII
jgi:hypothetical protein